MKNSEYKIAIHRKDGNWEYRGKNWGNLDSQTLASRLYSKDYVYDESLDKIMEAKTASSNLNTGYGHTYTQERTYANLRDERNWYRKELFAAQNDALIQARLECAL